MKNCMKRGLISIVLTIIIEVVFVFVIASNYFIGGLASGRLQEALVLIKFFLPTVIAMDWILNMSFTTSFRQKDAKRFLVLVIQYACAAGIFAYGIMRLKRRYMSWMPESFEHSHLYIKYTVLLILSVLPITDFRKWSVVWKHHCDCLKPFFKKTGAVFRKAVHALYSLWNRAVEYIKRRDTFLIALATIIMSYIVTETYTMNLFYEVAWNHMIWNLVLYAVIYMLLWILLRNVKWVSIVMVVFFMIAGIVNYYVIQFRGTPVVLGDLTVIGTALSVAGGFKYTIDYWFIAATLTAVIFLVLLIRIRQEKKKIINKKKALFKYIVSAAASYAIIFGLGYAGIKSEFLYNQMEPLGWNLILQSNTNGYLLSIVADSAKNLMDEPDGYDLDYLCAFMEETEASYDTKDLNLGISLDDITVKDGAAEEAGEPNIIVIMNESFSDLSVLGELETDVYYMPYVSSLTEDTIYGHLYVSPFGGNTVYSEFEFLTGNSMAFLPTGCIPYTQYFDSTMELPSMVSTMEHQSIPYETIAIHPYEKSGYNRVNVYNSFGFDQFITIDDFSDYTINRKYMQDEDDYKKIIETFENKEDGQPVFIFNITMQNHGGYGERTDYTLNEPVHVTNYSVDAGVDEYLSSLKEADTAVEILVDYFSTVDEPTMIVFFGDHQPQLSTGFYDSIFGKDSTELSFEETLQKHEVPFFIWSNYEDYGGQYVDAISTNYLSSLVMELAGLEMTDYQKFLLEVYDEYPAITAAGAMNKEGAWEYIDIFELKDVLLQNYEMLQYNYIFGDDERLNQYFYLD